MEEKEVRQLEFPPEFGGRGKKKEKPKPGPKPKSTLVVTGYNGDYIVGVKKGEAKKIRWKMMNQVRIALAKILGREIAYQPELEGLEGTEEKKERNKSKGG